MRLYNGCPDKELQAVMDARQAAIDELAALGIRATFFPAEGKWKGFKDYRSVSEFHDHPQGILNEVSDA